MTKSEQKTSSTFDKSQPDQSDQSKRTFFIGITVDLIYSIIKLAIISSLFSLVSYFELSPLTNSHNFKRMQQNLAIWEKQIIVDFRVVNSYNCPDGFEHYTTSDWPGNIEGCHCNIGIGLWDYSAVLQGRCSHKELAKGCKSVYKHENIPFYFWQAEKQLCVRRLKNYNFYSSFQNIVNPMNYPLFPCGKNSDYQIDLISVINCPVTNIKNDSSLNNSILDLGYSFHTQSDYPIVDFKISEYDFCQDQSEDNISPGRKTNYILQKRYRFECKTSDKRIITLAQQSQPSLLQINPRISAIINSLPAYPLPDDHFVYKLGFQRYSAWKYSCRKSSQFNLLSAKYYLNTSKVSSFVKTCQILLIAILSLCLIFLIWFIVRTYLHLRTKHMHGYLYLKDYEIKKINPQSNIARNKPTQIFKFIFTQIFPIIGCVILTVFYHLTSQTYQWYVSAPHCTDANTSSYFTKYQQFFGFIMAQIMISVFVFIGLILLDICYLLWRLWKGDLQEEESIQALDIRDISSVFSDGKDGNKINITQACLVDNAYKIEGQSEEKNLNFRDQIFNLQKSDSDQIVSQSEYSQSSQHSD